MSRIDSINETYCNCHPETCNCSPVGVIKTNKLIRYKCKTCGNTCLESKQPDNSICGGCNKPDWKIMKFQEAYIVGENNYTHPKGEI